MKHAHLNNLFPPQNTEKIDIRQNCQLNSFQTWSQANAKQNSKSSHMQQGLQQGIARVSTQEQYRLPESLAALKCSTYWISYFIFVLQNPFTMNWCRSDTKSDKNITEYRIIEMSMKRLFTGKIHQNAKPHPVV